MVLTIQPVKDKHQITSKCLKYIKEYGVSLLCLFPYLIIAPGIPSSTQSVMKAMFLK